MKKPPTINSDDDISILIEKWLNFDIKKNPVNLVRHLEADDIILIHTALSGFFLSLVNNTTSAIAGSVSLTLDSLLLPVSVYH